MYTSGHDIDGTEQGVDTVLVSTEIKLIFFLLAGIVLCFGPSMRTTLRTY